MAEWSVINIADLIGDGVLEIGDGYRAKNSEFEADGGLPFVRVGNVGSSIQTEGLDELPDRERDRYGSKVSRPQDSLITMKGTVGRVAWVRPSHRPFVYSPQISYWRSHRPDVVHPRWLRYWLESPEFGWQASATKGATDMADYINLRDQRRMTISLPPLGAQARIADVLGAMDDLIENNRRRVEVLEEMARAIYREWFVHFRFPGHESTTFVDSDLGPIPADWVARPLGQVVSLNYGKALKQEARRGGPVAVVGSSGVVGWHDEALVKGPAIVVGRKGNVGSITWVDGDCWPIDTAYFVDSELPLRYVCEHLRSIEFLNTHAAVPGLSREQAYAKSFLVPSETTMKAFTDVAGILLDSRSLLAIQADRLAGIRDLLLPKLVTGQIDVSHLDLDAVAERADV